VGGLVAHPFQVTCPDRRSQVRLSWSPKKNFPTNKLTNRGVPCGIPRLGHVAPCYSPIKMLCVQIPFIHLSYPVNATIPATLTNFHVSYNCMDLATSTHATCHPCSGATCHNLNHPPVHLPMSAPVHVNFPTHCHITI
jgi:hypothetical protein